MRIEEEVLVPAGRDAVWEFVWQTERVARCLPGCQSVDVVEPGRTYRAHMADRVGPYSVEAEMQITVEEVSPPDRVRMHAEGKDNRLGATQVIDLDLRLRSLTTTETALHVIGDVEVLGRVAAIGQFVIKRKMNDVIKKFGENIRAEVTRGSKDTSA